MNFSIVYCVITVTGVIFSFLQAILNGLIVQKCFSNRTLRTKVEFQLLIVRAVFDFVNGFVFLFVYLLTIPSLIYPEYLPFKYIFYFSLIATNSQESRSFLAAIISIERTLATYYPIKFYKYRNYIENIYLTILVISLGLQCDVVLFGICDAYPVSPNCTTIQCALTLCYQDYATFTKFIYSTITFIFSILLCIKLLIMGYKKTKFSSDLKKANLISLTDGLSTIIFELIPSIFFTFGIINILGVGPVTGTLRNMARSSEGFVMFILMKKQSSSQGTTIGNVVSMTSRKEGSHIS